MKKELVMLVPYLRDLISNWGTPIRIKGYTDGLGEIVSN